MAEDKRITSDLESSQQQKINGQNPESVNKLEYLSSDCDEENIEVEKNDKYVDDIKMDLKFFFLIILNLFFFLLMFALIAFIMTITLLADIFKGLKGGFPQGFFQFLADIFQKLWFILIACSTIDTEVFSIIYLTGDTILRYLFFDAITFLLSTLLVISYINICFAIYDKEKDYIDRFIGNRSLNTLVYQKKRLFSGEPLAFDVDISSTQAAFDRTLKNLCVQEATQRFKYFNLKQFPKISQYKPSVMLVDSYFEEIEPNFLQYFLIVCILLIKLSASFYYIFSSHTDLSFNDYFHVTVTVGLYIYISFILHLVLGNSDQRRKTIQLNRLLEKVNLFEMDENGYKEKLDITCSISIESWDNARKFVIENNSLLLKDLEFAYVCLFFQYVIVTLIIISAYGELYWIIPKDSAFLQPLMVIINTFNFVFLNTFLLLRIWEGQKFNDSFEEQELIFERYVDLLDDILTMYDLFFNSSQSYEVDLTVNYQRQKLEKQFKRTSIYGLIVKKIKFLSNHHINSKTPYQGRIYLQSEKVELRKEIISNVKSSFQKVKSSIHTDSITNCYKFLNVIQIKFSDTLTTILLGTITILPQVLPKLISYYSEKNEKL